MLLILSRAYLEEAASVALIAAPIICRALSSLLKNMDNLTGQFGLRGSINSAAHMLSIARFCLSSPWTMNLASDLKHLIADDNDPKSDYNLMLATRTLLSGEALLKEVSLINPIP